MSVKAAVKVHYRDGDVRRCKVFEVTGPRGYDPEVAEMAKASPMFCQLVRLPVCDCTEPCK